MKAKLTTPPACPSVDKVRECILSWEAEVRRYVDMSGKSFDDDDKIGALIQIVPPQVQNHIRLNPEKADTYDNLRKLVFAYAAAIGEAKPIDMDLSSFQQSQHKANVQATGPRQGGGKYGGDKGLPATGSYGQQRLSWKGAKSKGKGKSIFNYQSRSNPTSQQHAKGKGKGKSTKGNPKGGKPVSFSQGGKSQLPPGSPSSTNAIGRRNSTLAELLQAFF